MINMFRKNCFAAYFKSQNIGGYRIDNVRSRSEFNEASIGCCRADRNSVRGPSRYNAVTEEASLNRRFLPHDRGD